MPTNDIPAQETAQLPNDEIRIQPSSPNVEVPPHNPSPVEETGDPDYEPEQAEPAASQQTVEEPTGDLTLDDSAAEATLSDTEGTRLPATAEQAGAPAEPLKPDAVDDGKDAELAEQAYLELERLFKMHITAFMLEAGQYIIDTFYGGDAHAALVKNKSSKNPPSLKLLIEKIKAAPKNASGNAPSESWFYKAVSLAAHEVICKEMGLSTFTILGHSHKLQLLNAPKLKKIKADNLNEEIEKAFAEKERLAKEAVDEKLSVREFARRILKIYPPSATKNTADNVPDNRDLRNLPTKKLEGLRDKLGKRIADLQKQLRQYKLDKDRVEKVLDKKNEAPSAVAEPEAQPLPMAAMGA